MASESPWANGAKPSNPKDAVSYKKIPLMSVVPTSAIVGIALGMTEGALKYSRHNYRVVGVRTSVYVDACDRHLKAFWEGQNLDPDSKIGLHHLEKLLASGAVLLDSIKRGNWIDDRPPAMDPKWIDEANTRAAALVEQYPNPPAPCTQVMIDDAVAAGHDVTIPTGRKE
jgi:hypothetical protein